MISNFSLNSNSSSPFSWLTGTVPSASATVHITLTFNPSARAGYETRSIFKRSLTALNSEFSFSQTSCLILTCMFHTFFRQSPSICQSLRFLLFFSVASHPIYFDNQHKVLTSSRNQVIRLYLKISENFMGHILLERFLFVHVTVVGIFKLKSLAQFPVDHLSHPVVPILFFLLC